MTIICLFPKCGRNVPVFKRDPFLTNNNLKRRVSESLSRIPVVGESLVDNISRTKNSIKQLVIPGMLFENMGVTYLGPVDGHM